jgi:hypothetical protein
MEVLVEEEMGLVGLVDDEDVPGRSPASCGSNAGCMSRKWVLYRSKLVQAEANIGIHIRRTGGLGFLAGSTMLEPLFDGFCVLVWDDDPIVTESTENALGIKFANIGILGKELVSFLERIYIFVISIRRNVN